MKKIIFIAISYILVGFVAGYFYKNDNNQKISSQSEVNKITTNPELRDAFNESVNHSAVADIAELACFSTTRFDCGQNNECVASTPKTYYFVDYGTEGGTYFRCDIKGCDQYPVRVKQSGEFTQFIPLQGQSMLFKVASGDTLGNKGEFIDVATIGVDAIISTGKCEPLK